MSDRRAVGKKNRREAFYGPTAPKKPPDGFSFRPLADRQALRLRVSVFSCESEALVLTGNDGFDTTGLDLTFLASGHVADRLELYGALDFARNKINDTSSDFTTVHFVPGIEYRISPKLDFVAELGLGLNDDSSNYFAVGFALYFGTR